MQTKNIKTIQDLLFILRGIQYGAIKDKVFTIQKERTHLKEIMQKDIQFYIFEIKPNKEWYKKHKAKDVKTVKIGFGAIKDKYPLVCSPPNGPKVCEVRRQANLASALCAYRLLAAVIRRLTAGISA